jgi:hypothetical protein
MAETVDELTYNYEDDGKLVRKELSKEVLSKGAWATLMFLYQEMDRKTSEYRPPKVSIVRYKKSGGVYRKQSSFNISSEKQGRQIIEILEKWFAEDGLAHNPPPVEAAADADADLPPEDHAEAPAE